MADMEKIEKALTKAQVLYAVLLGKQVDRSDVSEAVEAEKAGLRASYEAAVEEQDSLDLAAEEAVKAAYDGLVSHQEKAKEELGVGIDMLNIKSGGKGHTRL